jgi:hypothetical protein|tara:strand:+ start:1577 stop:2233 length:657 start_codon:yes stop_codon:yes gene_type:complete
MAKNSIRDYDKTSGNNTDIQSVDISEGCSPAGINNALREILADLADVNDGTVKLVSPSFDAATIGSNAIDAFPSGTKMLFQQTNAPTGWTKDTTHNDKALRITNGSVGTGGSVAFETAFASHTPAGTVTVTIANHALILSEIPPHTHNISVAGTATGSTESRIAFTNRTETGTIATASAGGSGGAAAGHGHSGSTGSFSGTAIDLDVSYVDVIIATKN